MRATLIEGARALGLDLPVQAQQRLLDYVALIEKWNKVYNLTAIRDPGHMVVEHLLDSLAVSPHTAPGALLDLGSGAGLPGIPLSIARPDLQVTLLDSNRKKCAFLKQVTIELGLENVEVACVRAEVFRPGHRFENVVTRAFADLATIAALGAPLLAPGGCLLAMKGAEPVEELAQLGEAVRVQTLVRLNVPGLGAQRHLIVMTMA